MKQFWLLKLAFTWVEEFPGFLFPCVQSLPWLTIILLIWKPRRQRQIWKWPMFIIFSHIWKQQQRETLESVCIIVSCLCRKICYCSLSFSSFKKCWRREKWKRQNLPLFITNKRKYWCRNVLSFIINKGESSEFAIAFCLLLNKQKKRNNSSKMWRNLQEKW